MKKILLVVLAVLATSIAVKAEPGLLLDVTPVVDKVLPGETASYKVTVTSYANSEENVHLSITNPITGWTYSFSKNDFDLPAFENKTVDMYITVAPDASPGEYYHDVKAEGKVFGITVEETIYTDVLTTVIPEFTTIAVPVLIALGIVFLMRRR